ncbi:MAG: hypothetical protein A2161_20885 [Candidatus Schekmanbacteria bacterium RBG_13_48_7]|uniref:Mannose-1-phosphate guanyltransferase C-terminal domain-containing protein n=1 Tax=Candidatus Schekmanbacteria bacterium RBG_13_48_7 TaxID=1817878 RepID=A0A1F7RV35_9BACT|nr:MAG: hypothetical protein A2161_20885 [Candidatus Schekmanbacteria bacterium RBG_13_48_7]
MLSDYFSEFEEFEHAKLFKGVKDPWKILSKIPAYIAGWFREREKEKVGYQSVLTGVTFHKISSIDEPGNYECMIAVQYPVRLSNAVFLKPWNIFIGNGTILESNTIIKSPAIIGNNCQIRHTAYLRGNIIMGDNCVAGHSTEIKNSIFMNNACAGHFAYIGDSILGTDVNLGAGTKLANLQFRTQDEKKSRKIRSIVLKCGQKKIDTELKKFGAVIGDYVETGCNSVLAPGVMLGKNSWVFPNTFVTKGLYAPDSHIGQF